MMYVARVVTAAQVSSPLGTIWSAGRMNPYRPVSRSSTPEPAVERERERREASGGHTDGKVEVLHSSNCGRPGTRAARLAAAGFV